MNCASYNVDFLYIIMQMYMTLDALADGGVYAGVPKEQALNLVAHTMMVSMQRPKKIFD